MLLDVGKSKIDHALIIKSGKLIDEEFEKLNFMPVGVEKYPHG
jgi:HD-GYP domain-containing protein (c-di-GMP phosphodiesterase class II)